MVASRQSAWGEHLPGNGIKFLAKGFLEVNSQALNETIAGSPYYTPRPQLCGTPKWPQYQGKILSAMDIKPFQERPVELRHAFKDEVAPGGQASNLPRLSAAAPLHMLIDRKSLVGRERHVNLGV